MLILLALVLEQQLPHIACLQELTIFSLLGYRWSIMRKAKSEHFRTCDDVSINHTLKM